jgi:hypothetical protein
VARVFRFLEKKRGQRRTGSNLLGGVGEAVFCGSLFLLGTLALCIIIGAHLAQPDPDRFTFGRGGWLLILVSSSAVFSGASGLLWTVLRLGTSIERRSAMARRAADTDFVHAAAPRPRNFPTLPPFDGLTNSPGIELAYRLPSAHTPGWRLLATTVFAMLWNFVVCLLTVSVFSGHIAGRHEWLLTGLLVPFWFICYWSVRSFLQLLVVNSGMGQTKIEISDLPLMPGREYQIAIAQHGHVAMKSLELALVCEEEATFTQGTDIRIEVREVYRQSCLVRRTFRIEPERPFVETCGLSVPATAMHSLHAPHNVIRWKLVVHGEPEKWPAYDRAFPVVIYPGEATMRAAPAEPATEESPVIVSHPAALARARA